MDRYFDWEQLKSQGSELCTGHSSLVDAVGACISLEELFQLWKTAQTCERGAKEHADVSRHSTFPDLKNYRGSLKLTDRSYGSEPALCSAMLGHFCPDGFVTDEDPGAGDVEKATVLFMFREANISDDVVSCNGQITLRKADRFWLAEQWNDPHREELVKHNPYVGFMAKHIEGISIGRIAVMDLNKRGGFGTCNHTRLRHYVEVYEPFIRREIDIISPNIIICGGTFGTVKELLPNGLANRVKVWDCHHPRSWRDQDAGQIKKWAFEGSCRET